MRCVLFHRADFATLKYFSSFLKQQQYNEISSLLKLHQCAQINSRFKSKDNSESFNNMHVYTFYS